MKKNIQDELFMLCIYEKSGLCFTYRANGTDSLVLAIFMQAYFCFGTGRSHKNKPVLGIITRIGKSRALALPVFHAFLGFDVIFYLLERKKLCFELWLKYFEFTSAYIALSHMNPQNDDIYSLPNSE